MRSTDAELSPRIISRLSPVHIVLSVKFVITESLPDIVGFQTVHVMFQRVRVFDFRTGMLWIPSRERFEDGRGYG